MSDITITIRYKDDEQNNVCIDLSADEAKGIYEELKKLFGDSQPVQYVPYIPWGDPPCPPSQPWYWATASTKTSVKWPNAQGMDEKDD